MSDSKQARELLRELMSELLANSGNGDHDPASVPQVPPPPVAAVLRPSTWTEPAAHSPQSTAEPVTIDNDADLDRFVRALASRLEDPRAREAIRGGQIRFTLDRAAGRAAGAASIRIERGAVTERVVREAAANGQRLVLARGAVLTPLARDQARKLRVEIEKEHT